MCSSSTRVQRMPVSYVSTDRYSSTFSGSSTYSRRPLPSGGSGPYDEYGRKLKFESVSNYKPRTTTNLTSMGRLTPNKADYDKGYGSGSAGSGSSGRYTGLNYPYATSSSQYGATASSHTTSSSSKRTSGSDYRNSPTTSKYGTSSLTGTSKRKTSPGMKTYDTESPRTSSRLTSQYRSSSLFDLSTSPAGYEPRRLAVENGYSSGTERRRNSVVNDDVERLSRSIQRTSLGDRKRSESSSTALPRLHPKDDGSDHTPSSSRRTSLEESSSLVAPDPKYSDGGKIGLSNLGNTCFMNSVIQCLSNTKPLLEYCIKKEYLNDINSKKSSMKGALIQAFAKLLQSLWKNSNDMFVTPNSFKTEIQRFAPRFMGFQQQDSQEFLRYLLEGLHEDVNRVHQKPKPITLDDEKLDAKSDAEKALEYWHTYLRFDDSKIVDIFVGQLKSELTFDCGHKSVTFDPFWDLSLPLPKNYRSRTTLDDCLKFFMRKERLESDERPTCYKCKERRTCTKGFSIQRFPQILVLHLKRFSQERYSRKVTTDVEFPIQDLDLTNYAANPGSTRILYNLYAVSNHSGGTHSGHYTAMCKHPYREEWHSYNDTRVHRAQASQAVSSEAYLLFYELSGRSSSSKLSSS